MMQERVGIVDKEVDPSKKRKREHHTKKVKVVDSNNPLRASSGQLSPLTIVVVAAYKRVILYHR